MSDEARSPIEHPPASPAATQCAGCGQPLDSRFCPDCGELRAGERDYSIRGFLASAVSTVTNVDSRVGRTVSALFRRPGLLTADYMRGRRKAYLAPLQLFLISNVVFFFMNSIAGFNTFTTPLAIHLYRMPYSVLARSITQQRVEARDITISDYAVSFDAAAALHAKTLIIIMVPLFALFVTAAYWRSRRFYVQHLVFSLHFYTYMLLLTSVLQAGAIFTARLLARAGAPQAESTLDSLLTYLFLLLFGTYLFLALRRLHEEPLWLAGAKAVTLTFAVGMTLQLYRFILFFVTLYST